MQLFGYGALCLRDYSFPKNCARYAITIPDILLDELLAGVTPENVHHEFDWGRAQGKEAW
jgi:hypothetical protein